MVLLRRVRDPREGARERMRREGEEEWGMLVGGEGVVNVVILGKQSF